MRTFIIFMILMFLFRGVSAQEPTATPVLRDPHEALAGSLADECGAIDYLAERDHYRRTAYAGLNPTPETLKEIADLYVAGMAYRNGVLSIVDVPECVQELHLLTLRDITTTMDIAALYIAANAIPIGGQDYSFKSGQLSNEHDVLRAQVAEILVELGWLNEDLEIIIELSE